MSELAYLGLAEAADLIRARKLSPVEYTQALLDRTEKLDPRYHAYIKLTPERAMEAARRAEREVTAGTLRGPLHGVPYGLKDIIDVAGLPTTGHSKVLIDNVAAANAVVTERLEAAGGILMGKLATHEFAIGGPSFDLPWPPAVNPVGRQIISPGGSSSGSGVALAAGLVPAALGTDTGGSVRNPASLCGITGMKPTYGLVSRRGVFPLAYSLDHVGPMTRDVRDNALLLQVLAGYDAEDPGSANVHIPDYSADLDARREGAQDRARAALLRRGHAGGRGAAAGDRCRGRGAARPRRRCARSSAGAALRLFHVHAHHHLLRGLRHSPALARATRPADYGDLARRRILEGAAFSAADYIDAQRMRARLTKRTLEALAGFDAALTASSMDPTVRIDDAEACLRVYPRQARQPFNVTGQPALAMPAGFTKDGLPLSLQLVGHPFQEAMVYRIAAAYERATGWIKRHPPGL